MCHLYNLIIVNFRKYFEGVELPLDECSTGGDNRFDGADTCLGERNCFILPWYHRTSPSQALLVQVLGTQCDAAVSSLIDNDGDTCVLWSVETLETMVSWHRILANITHWSLSCHTDKTILFNQFSKLGSLTTTWLCCLINLIESSRSICCGPSERDRALGILIWWGGVGWHMQSWPPAPSLHCTIWGRPELALTRHQRSRWAPMSALHGHYMLGERYQGRGNSNVQHPLNKCAVCMQQNKSRNHSLYQIDHLVT